MFRRPAIIKIFITVIFATVFVFLYPAMLLAYSQAQEYLCEIGIKFYQQGRYNDALQEFRKALMLEPDSPQALKYIQMINQRQEREQELRVVAPEEIIPLAYQPTSETPSGAINQYLELMDIEADMIREKRLAVSQEFIAPPGLPAVSAEAFPRQEEKYLPQTLTLDETINEIFQPIQIEQGRGLIIYGKNIQRFLVTQPEILSAEKESPGQIIITGKGIGHTYVHIWDDHGRWTLEFMGTQARPEGPTVAELARLEEEKASAFRLRYALNWDSYEEGRRLTAKELNRMSFSWYHSLDLTGPIPYGTLDSRVVVRSLKETTDLTHFTVGLSEGRWLNFKDFTLRGFDFSPDFYNLALSGAGVYSQRGVMIKSPVFHNKINYTAFWGREGGGAFGNLSPGLQKLKNSYLNGFDLNYYPFKYSNFGFTVVRGYGHDRPSDLNDYAYDANANFRLGKWDLGYEIGYDSETFAHLLAGKYSQPRLSFNYELRNIDKNFLNIGGQAWRRGERGGLFNLNYVLHPGLSMSHRLDIYQDRLFPALDNANRWNENYDFSAQYSIDPVTSLRLAYTLQNNLGKISQYRYQSPSLGLSRTINFIKKVSTYVNFRHQDNKNYSGPQANYINEGLASGIRFSLIGQLYYFFNQQWNWLEAKYAGDHSRPHAYETGVDFNSQLFHTPFYENVRLMFRDEEDTTSSLSFLSGQDYIEGYTELSYRPNPEQEAFCSARIRNVWAEEPTVAKRIEADFNAGMRYTWDTGLRWEAVGSIEGYVFKDLNSDGLRQRDEAPMQGVKIWLGKNKSAVTDLFGYYKFAKIKGRKAFITLDTQSIPAGFVLTLPQTQEIVISQGRAARIDFGMVSRSEIYGFVFWDSNEDGEYNSGDTGIADVLLALKNGKEIKTDSNGRYYFTNISVGEHTLTLNVNSLPKDYLPTVPIMKKISLSENITYIYNISLKKIEE